MSGLPEGRRLTGGVVVVRRLGVIVVVVSTKFQHCSAAIRPRVSVLAEKTHGNHHGASVAGRAGCVHHLTSQGPARTSMHPVVPAYCL